MSETHTPEIRPATDEEIAMWRGLSALALERHGSLGQAWITLDIRKTQLDALLARIESDRATIAELLAALERFADRRCRFDMPGLCAKVTNIEKCDRCHARAVIQKAKESR